MRTKPALIALLLALTGCAGQENTEEERTLTASTPSPSGAPALADGDVVPGRYRFGVPDFCDETKGCPVNQAPPLPTLEVAVPAGWQAIREWAVLSPAAGRDTTSRNDPALSLGATNYWVGLNSRPCRAENGPAPDIAVGPTVDDFVNAVTAHPSLDVTTPRPVTLGRHSGRFFTLTGPADISTCAEWLPWAPAPYLQGPSNTWDVWVMNVDGIRVVIMAEYFPETPTTIKTELRDMAESVRFLPRAT